MKKVLMLMTLYVCLFFIMILYSINVNTSYQINSITYMEDTTIETTTEDTTESETEEIEKEDPYKLNIGSSSSPIIDMGSATTSNGWTQNTSALGFRVSLVLSSGSQTGYSKDYYIEKVKTKNVHYNIATRKSKTTFIANTDKSLSNVFSGYKTGGVSSLTDYSNISRLPTGVTLTYGENNTIDWSSVINYFDSKVYTDGKYDGNKIMTYVSNTFNRDLSNYCINDYYLLIEPLILIEDNNTSLSEKKYYFGTPTELAYLMKEKGFTVNLDAMSHYMYYDSNKTNFTNLTALQTVSGANSSVDNLLNSMGYGVGVIWLGNTNETCTGSSNTYCTDKTTGKVLDITNCVDYEMDNPPVAEYTPQYYCVGSNYQLSGTTCKGIAKSNIKCSQGSYAVINGKGTCTVTSSSIGCNSGGSYISNGSRMVCRYTKTGTCSSGSWNDTVKKCVATATPTCSSGTWNSSLGKCVLSKTPECNDDYEWNSDKKTCRIGSTNKFTCSGSGYYSYKKSDDSYACRKTVTTCTYTQQMMQGKVCITKPNYEQLKPSKENCGITKPTSDEICCRYSTSCTDSYKYNSTLGCESGWTLNSKKTRCYKDNSDKRKKCGNSAGKGYEYNKDTGKCEKKINPTCNTSAGYNYNSTTKQCEKKTDPNCGNYTLVSGTNTCIYDSTSNFVCKDSNYSIGYAGTTPYCYTYDENKLYCDNEGTDEGQYHKSDSNTKCTINDIAASWRPICPAGYNLQDQSYTKNCIGSYVANGQCCSREVSKDEATRKCTTQMCAGQKYCNYGMNDENVVGTQQDITDCYNTNILKGYDEQTSLDLCQVEKCYAPCASINSVGKYNRRTDNEYQNCIIGKLQSGLTSAENEENKIDLNLAANECRKEYCPISCYNVNLSEQSLTNSLVCRNTDKNNEATYIEVSIPTEKNTCEEGSSKRYGRRIKSVGNCDIYCLETVDVSFPGNVSTAITRGNYFEWPTDGGKYPLNINVTQKCRIIVREGERADSACANHKFTPEDFVNNIQNPSVELIAGQTVSETKSEHYYKGNLNIVSDFIHFNDNWNGHTIRDRAVIVRRSINYNLDYNVNRYYNRLSGKVYSYSMANTFDRKKGVISTSLKDEPGIYNLKLKVYNLGTSNIIGNIINDSNYTCDYEVSGSLTTSGLCRCPAGTANYNKDLPFACSNMSCSELQAKYCDDSEITIPVCENDCKGDCNWVLETEEDGRLTPKYKYCDGNSKYCDIDFECPNDKVMTGDAKTCVINKLRYYGYIENNDLVNSNVDRASLDEILKECVPSVCSYNYNSKIIFRTIDLNNPFPGESGSGRQTGSNWDKTFISDKISNARKTTTNTIYQRTPLYTIKLTPDLIKTIRKYNETNEYDNFEMKCLNSSDQSACISKLLHGEIEGYNLDGLLTQNLNNKIGVCNNLDSSSKKTDFYNCYNKN